MAGLQGPQVIDQDAHVLVQVGDAGESRVQFLLVGGHPGLQGAEIGLQLLYRGLEVAGEGLEVGYFRLVGLDQGPVGGDLLHQFLEGFSIGGTL